MSFFIGFICGVVALAFALFAALWGEYFLRTWRHRNYGVKRR
jgi:hypothetical protein